MLSKIDVNKWRETVPYYIYHRVNMITGRNPFFHTIEPGYWYIMRQIRSKWPELDAAGAVFVNEINIEVVGSSIHRSYQIAAYPLNQISSPGSQGVQINATGNLTATGPAGVVFLDNVRPLRDNITFYLSGQNTTPFPAFVDIFVIGYLVPDTREIQWKGVQRG